MHDSPVAKGADNLLEAMATTTADETLLSWAQQAGARTAGLCIDAGPSGERGVFAAGDLHARAEVLAVPRTLVITDADARERSAAVRAALDAEFTELRVRERPEMQLMLHLVQMMANRAADDSMAPWLDALPASFETMPLNCHCLSDLRKQHTSRISCWMHSTVCILQFLHFRGQLSMVAASMDSCGCDIWAF